MPNWCSSVWFFSGKPEDIDRIEATKLDFDAIMPMPKILERSYRGKASDADKEAMRKECGYDDWYEWCNAKWGTKWPAINMRTGGEKPDSVRAGPDRLVVAMDTAWCLPMGIINKIAEDYPSVKIRITCMEEALFFGGTILVESGEVTENLHEPTEEESEAWMNKCCVESERLATLATQD